MAAGTVHDLCNALTVVLGSLEQLRRQPLDARGRQQLDRAEWGARHAGRLARALLAPDEAAEAAVVDLNETVRAFAATLGQGLGDGARFAVEAASGPLPVRLDRAELDRALLNLVRNATDATAGGQVVIRTAGHRADGLGGLPTVEVAVSDTGRGMAPGTVRHATEAFTTKGREHGTGLGLWTVRRFAEDAGGKVEIETEPGRGTTVRIVLPRAEAG
jgi:signal transduction histidine kinase